MPERYGGQLGSFLTSDRGARRERTCWRARRGAALEWAAPAPEAVIDGWESGCGASLDGYRAVGGQLGADESRWEDTDRHPLKAGGRGRYFREGECRRKATAQLEDQSRHWRNTHAAAAESLHPFVAMGTTACGASAAAGRRGLRRCLSLLHDPHRHKRFNLGHFKLHCHAKCDDSDKRNGMGLLKLDLFHDDTFVVSNRVMQQR